MPRRCLTHMKLGTAKPSAIVIVIGATALISAFALTFLLPTQRDSWERQLPEFQEIAKRLYEGDNEYLGSAQIRDLRRRLDVAPLAPYERLRATVDLCSHLLRVGDIDDAIVVIEDGFRLARSNPRLAAAFPVLHRMRALTYMRQAEWKNCVLQHNSACCILPLRGEAIHQVAGPAREASRSFEDYLALTPNDLGARWLLNIMAMAVDEYPQGVPERYVIPPSAFEPDYDIGRFVDIAGDLGIDPFNLAGGAIVEDFDNDGFLDIATSTFDPKGPFSFYRNLGNGRFEDRSETSHLSDQLGGLNCIAGDYNNDGFSDILILRGAWLFDDGLIRNSLLRNNGDGTFTDVTRAAGIDKPAYPTQTAAWGDFDNDGDLDLYVGNESRAELVGRVRHFPSQLFRNDGDGTFTDIARQAGVLNDRYCKGVAVGDYDNDGHLDLYVSNIGENRLYHNNGDGTFTDVAAKLGVTRPRKISFATWFFDYNNDGWLDLFVAAYDAPIEEVCADYLGLPHRATPPCLFQNNGDGTFTDVARKVGLAHAYFPMGSGFGDLDNDGFLDIYLATGGPKFVTLMPNVMLRNDAALKFQNVTASGGFGHLQKGHGVAFADIDNDGDQDIYHQLGGFYPGDRFHNVLFQNPGHGNHFLKIKLVGSRSNRSGIGARIKVTFTTAEGLREVHRAVGSVSSFGSLPLRQEIGLGQAHRVDLVEVIWPTTGTHQAFSDVPLDALITITEDKKEFTVEQLRRISFDKR